MKRKIALALLVLALPQSLFCANNVRDTEKTDIQSYAFELGYFQKANRDLSDPRFMISDDGGRFQFGIGGTVRAMSHFSFNGNLYTLDFRPSRISVPTDYINSFGLTMKDTEIHFKARSYMGRHKILAYVQIEGDVMNQITLSRAYVSFNGFSIGKIPSFFLDLETNPRTVGQGPNSLTDKTHPLIGYTHQFGQHWIAGISVEEPLYDITPLASGLDEMALSNENQPMPDFAAYGKYRFGIGHVQLSGLVRRLTHWANSKVPEYETDGYSRYCMGWGLSLSTKISPSRSLSFSAQVNGGKGIQDYLTDFDGLSLNTARYAVKDENGLYPVLSLPVFGAFISAQYAWGERLCSTLSVGYNRIFSKDGLILPSVEKQPPVDRTVYGGVNLFWDINRFTYVGVEYTIGYKWARYGVPDVNIPGHSNRLTVCAAYCF